MAFSTVVAGLDLGPRTQPVADFARALAQKLGAKLVYLHAEEEAPLLPEWNELALEARRLRQLAGERHSAEGGAEVVWRPGPPAAALQVEAEARDAGFVVAGTGAEGPLPALGKTATHLLRSVTVPLCLVPTHDGAHTELRGGTILAPVDFSTHSSPALGFVRRLAQRLSAKVSLMTVVRPPSLVAHLGPDSAARLPELLRALVDQATLALQAEAHAAGLDLAALRVVESDDPVTTILAEARDREAELIVLPAHAKGRLERLFVGSTTEKLARRTDRPVLIFPPTWLSD